MKRLLKLFAVLLLALMCYASAAMAQVPRAPQKASLEPAEGITQALERIGCHRNHLALVMEFNGLSFAHLRNLPVGYEFSYPLDCSEAGVHPFVGQMSGLIMQMDQRVYRQAVTLREAAIRITALQTDLEMRDKLFNEEQARANSLVGELNAANDRIVKLEAIALAKTNDTGAWSINGWHMAGWGFVTLVLIAWAVTEKISAKRLLSENTILRSDLQKARNKTGNTTDSKLANLRAELTKTQTQLAEQTKTVQRETNHAIYWQQQAWTAATRKTKERARIKSIFRRLRANIRENNAFISELERQLAEKEASLELANSELHQTRVELAEAHEQRRKAEQMAGRPRITPQTDTKARNHFDIPLEEDPAYVLTRAYVRSQRDCEQAQKDAADLVQKFETVIKMLGDELGDQLKKLGINLNGFLQKNESTRQLPNSPQPDLTAATSP